MAAGGEHDAFRRSSSANKCMTEPSSLKAGMSEEPKFTLCPVCWKTMRVMGSVFNGKVPTPGMMNCSRPGPDRTAACILALPGKSACRNRWSEKEKNADRRCNAFDPDDFPNTAFHNTCWSSKSGRLIACLFFLNIGIRRFQTRKNPVLIKASAEFYKYLLLKKKYL